MLEQITISSKTSREQVKVFNHQLKLKRRNNEMLYANENNNASKNFEEIALKEGYKTLEATDIKYTKESFF